MMHQRPEKLSVLHWQPSFVLPTAAGEYLILDENMKHHVCDAEFEDNGTFVCFRSQCSQRDVFDNQVVLAHAWLNDKAGIVQSLYSDIPRQPSPLCEQETKPSKEPTLACTVVDFLSAAKRIGAPHVS